MKNPFRIHGIGSAVDLSFQHTAERKEFEEEGVVVAKK